MKITDDVGDLILHVVPSEDLIPHVYTEHCHCGPRTEWVNLRKMVVHEAWDQDEDRSKELN